MSFDAATKRQHHAADPARSTWLTANAGSGKTRVLTDRVARLLLAGVDPQHILCLTYTKAAASEMQNRLFSSLGGWAMLSDNALAGALAKLGEPGPHDLSHARTLFARAIETPGGLKIQTIHAFCAAILRRFPLEAGVSPQFTEIDEGQASALRADVMDALAQNQPQIIGALAERFTGEGFDALSAETVTHQDRFAGAEADLRSAFGLAKGETEETLAGRIFLGGEGALLARLQEILSHGSANDQKAAERLRGVGTPPDVTDLPVLESIFLFGERTKAPFGSKAGTFPTKASRAALGADANALDALMDRVAEARETRLALAALDRSQALHAFARAFLPAYAEAKAQRGWLDFDDLIRQTRTLLSDSAAASWVLYRLDGRIEHILVDEAQDTSPAQWEVIGKLAEEMASGDDGGPPRSLFVVGDRKQSIYSFQGADAAAFDRMRTHFEQRLAPGRGLNAQQLEHSFRSSAAILSAVDHTIAAAGGLGEDSVHLAFHETRPGRVDLWPVVPPAEAVDPGHWSDPVDLPGSSHHSVVLAQRIAQTVRRMVNSETIPAGNGRKRIGPGDVLILVQGRNALFHNIIRACKTAGLDVAGADRLKLAAELAVKDLVALLSFLALPEDDLSLAAALRSPLFGLSEAQLYELAAKRDGRFLWAELRAQRNDFPDAVARLTDLASDADFLRPYELLDRILTRHGGRNRLLARLGTEAEDGIDALLNQTLAYERMHVPSLTGFLAWYASEAVEVKRRPEGAGDKLRVMTVHGAKGLEAPIVILPDTLRADPDRAGEVLVTEEGAALWSQPRSESPAALAAAREAKARADREERQRLLYVAMTRAESWLIVCGAGDRPARGGTWYDHVEAGLRAAGAEALPMPDGDGLRLSHGDWATGETVEGAETVTVSAEIADWMRLAAPTPSKPETPLSPSDLGGAKALPGASGLDEEAALARGTRLHRLLEILPGGPPDEWQALADSALGGIDELERSSLLAEARAVLTKPSLAPLWSPDALVEVEISAELPDLSGRRITGAIDRLIGGPGRVLAIDFKSNATVPARPEDTPDGLLRQMGAYAAALSRIYPDRPVETAILWTRTATLMRLPHDIVRRAFQEASTS